MFVPLQPVVFSVILCSLASALIVVHRARSKRLLGCSTAAGEGYKKAHLTFTDSEEKTGQPAAGCWAEHEQLLHVMHGCASDVLQKQ